MAQPAANKPRSTGRAGPMRTLGRTRCSQPNVVASSAVSEHGGYDRGKAQGSEEGVLEIREELAAVIEPVAGPQVDELEQPPDGDGAEEQHGVARGSAREERGAPAHADEGINDETIAEPEEKEQKVRPRAVHEPVHDPGDSDEYEAEPAVEGPAARPALPGGRPGVSARLARARSPGGSANPVGRSLPVVARSFVVHHRFPPSSQDRWSRKGHKFLSPHPSFRPCHRSR